MRLDDRAVQARLAELNEQLERLEQIPGQTSALAVDTVEALVEVYGEALCRVMDIAAGTPLADALAADDLIANLLLLHDVHPVPLNRRLEEALDRVRPYVHSHGGQVELLGVADGVARVRFSGSCDGCTASSATLESGIREALLAAAPELTGVEAEDGGARAHPPPVAPPAVIPLASVRRPAATGGRA